tara:strand:+ start:3889 stop:4149 length:261 start_codon:yes stop_codon:yes gene_type:complete
MKTKPKTKPVAINWIASPRDDWDGVELIDPVSGDVHVTISTATPEALALIEAAPKLLALLKDSVERHPYGKGKHGKKVIKQAEGKA